MPAICLMSSALVSIRFTCMRALACIATASFCTAIAEVLKKSSFDLASRVHTYRLEVDEEFVFGRVGVQSLDGRQQFGIGVQEMRPRNGHRGAEFARAYVEQTLSAAHCAFGHVGRAEALVVRILRRGVECVCRGSEAVTFYYEKQSNTKERVIYATQIACREHVLFTSNAVMNDVLLEDERQTAAQIRIVHVNGRVRSHVGRVGRSVRADNVVALVGRPVGELGSAVPIVDVAVIGHRIATGEHCEGSVSSRTVFLSIHTKAIIDLIVLPFTEMTGENNNNRIHYSSNNRIRKQISRPNQSQSEITHGTMTHTLALFFSQR